MLSLPPCVAMDVFEPVALAAGTAAALCPSPVPTAVIPSPHPSFGATVSVTYAPVSLPRMCMLVMRVRVCSCVRSCVCVSALVR